MTHAEMVEEVIKLHEWVKHWQQRAEAAETALADCTASHQWTDVAPKSLWCPDVKSPR